MKPSPRLHRAVSFTEAVENSPSLARLTGLVEQSSQRLKAIESLLPQTLRAAIHAGPIDGDDWCLLVSNNAAAAKLRQLIPLIQARLADKGWKVTSIRIKILMAGR